MPRWGTHLHGRPLGAFAGAIAGIALALIVHSVVANDTSGLFAFPATIATATFVGVVIGLMFASIIVGGREDDRATAAANNAIQRLRTESRHRKQVIVGDEPQPAPTGDRAVGEGDA